MPEVVADLDYRIVDEIGREYYASVVAEETLDGRWEAWLEFVPLDNDLNVHVTGTETWQTDRASVAHWVSTLSEVYVQGAFARANTTSTRAAVLDRLSASREVESAPGVDRPPDPFEIWKLGPEVLRASLSLMPRADLMAMIDDSGLNPAGKDLSRLTDRQLVTFVMTAVEAQILQGRR